MPMSVVFTQEVVVEASGVVVVATEVAVEEAVAGVTSSPR